MSAGKLMCFKYGEIMVIYSENARIIKSTKWINKKVDNPITKNIGKKDPDKMNIVRNMFLRIDENNHDRSRYDKHIKGGL